MKLTPFHHFPLPRRALVLVLFGVAALPVHAAPAQEPLLGRAAKAIPPNVMLTIDDSGSMSWNFMPDGVYLGSYTKLHPGEPDNQHGYSYTATLPTRLNDWVSARMRSSVHNRIYYNPDVRYQPWTLADGKLMPDAPPTAAPVNPSDASWGTVNLVGELKYTGTICRSSAKSGGSVVCEWASNEPIAPATYYEYIGPYSGDKPSKTNDAANFKRVRIMDSASFVRGSGRTDCTKISETQRSCTQAQEYQNFANWYTYNRNRHSLAMTALSAAFAEQGSGMRLGYARINQGKNTVDGVSTTTIVKGVRPYDDTTRSALFNWLLKTVKPTGSTPLPEAQDAVGAYFMRGDHAGPWARTPGDGTDTTAHLECRKSYQILMTDGYWSGSAATPEATKNVDGTTGPVITGPGGRTYQYVPSAPYADKNSGYLADVAMYYWNRDLRPDLANRVPPTAEDPAFWQHLTTFTIGLGVNGVLRHPDDLDALVDGKLAWGTDKIDDLWHAAVNGHGRYLSAANGPELKEALSSILAEIVRRSGSTAGIGMNGRVLNTGSRKFVPSYTSGTWTGELIAYSVGADGTTGAELWRASQAIPAPESRNIVVGTHGSSPAALPLQWDSLTPDLKADFGPGASAGLIGWLRGVRTGEGSTWRERESLLGDIVNSAPVFVKDSLNLRYSQLPPGTPGRDTYTDFVQAKTKRTGTIWFGANDGMLHAVRESDGVEVFAYVPHAVVGRLADLASPSYQHRYTVDGPLTESDVHFGGGWKTVLVGSTGAGARAIFALNVSDPGALGTSSVLWEYEAGDDENLGHVLAPIEIGRLRNGRWAAVFGNGYDSANHQASLFIVDIETGKLIRRIDTGVGSAAARNGLGGVRLVRDGQQTITGAYAGDLLGNVWMFDLSADTAVGWGVGLSGKALYTLPARADGSRVAITAAPAVVTHPHGGQMVLVGTGKLFEEGDQNATGGEWLYGLWDKQLLERRADGSWRWSTGSVVPQDRVKAGAITENGAGSGFYRIEGPELDWSVDRGWSLALSMEKGQRQIVAPQLVTGLALFETLVPLGHGSDAADPCNVQSVAGGYNLLIDPLSGGMPTKAVLDITGDGVIDESDSAVGGWRTDGWGGASVVVRDPPRSHCTGAACVPPPPPTCPPGQVRSNLQNTGAGGTNVCVAIPGPQRWWWRQVSNP